MGQVQVRLSDEQAASLKQLVAASGVSQNQFCIKKIFQAESQGALAETVASQQATIASQQKVIEQLSEQLKALGRERDSSASSSIQNARQKPVLGASSYQIGVKLEVDQSALLWESGNRYQLKSQDFVLIGSVLYHVQLSYTKKRYLTPKLELIAPVAAKAAKEAKWTTVADVQRWQQQYQRWVELFGEPDSECCWGGDEDQFNRLLEREHRVRQEAKEAEAAKQVEVAQQDVTKPAVEPVQEKLTKKQMAERSGLSMNQVARTAKAGAVIPVGSDVWVKTGDFWQISQDSAKIEEVGGIQSHG